MFTDINTNSTQRIIEVREYLDFINANLPAPPAPTPKYINTGKGLVYVQLYGIVEFTVNSTISKCILYINSDQVKLSEIKHIIYAMALNPLLESLYDARKTKWSKRYNLFSELQSDPIVDISSDLMPTDGKNIHFPQLESIWQTFCITEPILHDNAFRGRLQDIVTNRINIAHGNESAADVGSRVSIPDLYNRLNDVSAFCTYIISTFDDYIKQKKYKI